MVLTLSGDNKGAASLGLTVDGLQLDSTSSNLEVVEETALETSESGIIMLASLPNTSASSGSHEQQTAIVVTPVHDSGKNRIHLEYSQPLLETNQRAEPHAGDILRVSMTGSTELRSNRSLEALCNAADSELKNIGHEAANDKQLVHVKDNRHSNQVSCVMSSAVDSNSRLVLPAIRFASETDNARNSPSEAVLLVQKPVAISDRSYANVGFYMPVKSNAVSSGIGIGNSSGECSSSVTASKNLPQTMHMSSSVVQSSPHDLTLCGKPSRHVCRFCGRACAKPSVLQKHIRTHTGERPFPCMTCRLSFKTKSNLYKHCKSRTHSRTNLYACSGAECLSATESLSSASETPVAKDRQPDADVDVTAGSNDDNQEQQLKNAQPVSHLQPCSTFADKLSPSSAGETCKLLTVIDGNMYVMEKVALQSWQPVIQQLQRGTTVSLGVPLQTCAAQEDGTMQSEKLTDKLHSSVKVEVVPTAHPDLSSCSRVVPPINQSSTTAESLQEHITRLISENASIINTPMAEAPRAKRVLRQSSDVTASSTAKPATDRQLLRTRSLTPCPTALPVSTQNDDASGDCLEGSRQKLLHRAASDTAAYSPPQISGLSSASKQFLTVPKESHCIDDVTSRIMSLPSEDGDDTLETDIQCNEVRIVLELADSSTTTSSVTTPEISKESSVSHLPVLSPRLPAQPFSVIACKSAMNSQPTARQNPTLLPVTSPVPTVPPLCMIKPVEQASTSGGGLPIQYVQANAMRQPVPVQCVLLSNSDVTLPVTLNATSAADSHSGRPVIVEVVATDQHPRRGRPKGSKNRPKLAASASEPRGSVTPRTVAVREPLSAGVMSAPTTDALWRLKLKDQLMRRSLSSERHASSGHQKDKPVSVSSASVSQSQTVSTVSSQSVALPTAKGSQLLSTSSLGTTSSAAVTTEPVVRSRSCDASVPPKKRRKTLTELGRGTAFGTRIEEPASAIDSRSDRVASQSSLSVTDDSVFESPTQTLPPVSSAVNAISSANLFPLTNRALQVMYNSPPRASALCSSAVMHASDTVPDSVKLQSRFIRLPTCIGSKIPGLVRCTSLAPESDSTVPALPMPILTDWNNACSPVCARDDLKVAHCSAAVEIFPRLVRVSDSHSSTCVTANVPSTAVTESGQNVVCNSVASVDETELFELPHDVNASSGTLLLLGHCYPSLGIVAEPTFCSILGTQPACIETGNEADGHESTYNSWRASSSAKDTSDELMLTARETFSLYRTLRLGKDISYAAAPAFDSRSGGVLTHSSYWKYRTDRGSSDVEEQPVTTTASTVADVGETVDVVTTSAKSRCSTEKDAVSLNANESLNVASEVAPSDWKTACSRSAESEVSQKRVWIFPGGYRSTEAYVYVRGRGRGRYVCATCGVRCKKPSVLRKHLRSHTDIRPHHCHVCDVGFKTKGNLSKHLNSKAHHSRSSELGSSGEQVESGKSVEGSSCDADLDSSCELVRDGSAVDPESDSGCELQPGSSCEVEPEAVLTSRQSSSVETDGENRDVGRQPLISGVETNVNASVSPPQLTSLNQQLVITPTLQQLQPQRSKFRVA